MCIYIYIYTPYYVMLYYIIGTPSQDSTAQRCADKPRWRIRPVFARASLDGY